jgi:flagellar hook-associated protein 1 FlgK
MGTDVFSINVSALQVAQIGLATTENNIANASTPGYNRETVVQNENPGQLSGGTYVGTGVNVGTVQRIYNQFLTTQLTQQQGSAAQLNTYYSQIQQINNMLGSSTAGLSPALQSFFSAVNGVANSPDSIPARQTMLSAGQSLSATFQSMSQQLTGMNTAVNQQLSTNVDTVNSDAQQIAVLNQNIMLAQSASGQPPNQLLDQRDQLVGQLNQVIGATVTKQGDGSYTVSVGNGQLLVSGANSYSLKTVASPTDPTQVDVAYGSPGGQTISIPQSGIQGGSIGGLLAFRSQSLVPAQSQLGLIADGVAGAFNQQSSLGMDLNGNMASSANSFFTDPPPPVVNPSTANTGTVQVTASIPIGSVANLTGSNYSLSFDGTNYTLTNLSSNATRTFAASALPITNGSMTIDVTGTDGFKINIPTTPPMQKGDSYTINPTANGATNFAVAITDPSKIAAATPVITGAGANNTGTTSISAGTVSAGFATTTVNPAVTLTYNSAANTLSGFPNVPVTVTDTSVPPVTTTFAAGAPVTYAAGATISFGGASFVMTGTPANGDTFTVAQNTNAPTDNRNALLLANLQTQNTMLGSNGQPTASFVGVYGQLVSLVGNQTNQLNVTSTAQNTLVTNTTQAQQSVSGVNLDEEAANLLRYQQAYQAAAKAMQIANTLFDSIISLGK